MKGLSRILLSLGVLAAALSAGLDPVQAATSPTKSTMATTASVANSCRIVALDSIGFGAYSPISGAAATSTGAVHLICTKATTATVIPTSGGSKMTGGSGTIAYGLYTDAAMSKVWGQPTQTTATINLDSTPLYLANYVTTDSASCGILANGGIYYWRNWSPSGNCAYGYSATPTSFTAPTISAGAGLIVGSAVLSSPTSNSYGSIFVPTNSTLVSGHTYTIITGVGSQATLSGAATSAATPLVLTYYAKAAAGQDVVAGAYTDTVVVQVTF